VATITSFTSIRESSIVKIWSARRRVLFNSTVAHIATVTVTRSSLRGVPPRGVVPYPVQFSLSERFFHQRGGPVCGVEVLGVPLHLLDALILDNM